MPRQSHQSKIMRIAPPALKGARKSECASIRENSPSGWLAIATIVASGALRQRTLKTLEVEHVERLLRFSAVAVYCIQ